jgi:hypothetical protein
MENVLSKIKELVHGNILIKNTSVINLATQAFISKLK